MRRISTLISFLLAIGGCAADASDKSEEGDAPFDGKLDSFRAPTEHGQLAFGETARAALTRSANFHVWTFDVGQAGRVRLTAGKPKSGVDTVLYAYRRNDDGSYGAALDRNDDVARGDRSSKLELSLSVGTYRVLVKSHSGTQAGDVDVTLMCTSGTCTARPVRELCVFGDGSLDAAVARRRFGSRGRQTLHQNDVTNPFDQSKVVAAVAAHEMSVTDLARAFAFAGGAVDREELFDIDTRKTYEVLAFLRGGQRTGAIVDETGALAATIVNGAIAGCTANETAPVLSCDALSAMVDSECQTRSAFECLVRAYPMDWAGAGSYAAQCCADRSTLGFCSELTGNTLARVELVATTAGLASVHGAHTYSIAGAPADVSVLRNVQSLEARMFGDRCLGVQPVWQSVYTHVAPASALASNIDEVEDPRILDTNDLRTLKTYARTAMVDVYLADVGDPDCETSGSLVFFVDGAHGQVSTVWLGSGS